MSNIELITESARARAMRDAAILERWRKATRDGKDVTRGASMLVYEQIAAEFGVSWATIRRVVIRFQQMSNPTSIPQN